MSRKPKTIKSLEALVPDLIFSPTPAMRKVKAAFWVKIEAAPFFDKKNITRAIVEDILNKKMPNNWWSEPGFTDWFTEQDEFRIKAKAMMTELLDHAYDIAVDSKANPGARINAMKFIQEAGKQVIKQENINFDAELAKMGVKDANKVLEEYLDEKS